MAGARRYLNLAFVIFRNNKIGHRKAKTRSLPHILGGKKGLKHSFPCIRSHARAIVRYFDTDHFLFLKYFQNKTGGSYCFNPHHGLGAIGQDIEKYLLKFAGFTIKRGQSFCIVSLDLYFFKIKSLFQVVIRP